MQFSVDKNLLYSNIQKVAKVSPARSTMPILASILFELKGNDLTLRTSDIAITMHTTFEVKGGEDGKIAISTIFIQSIVGELVEGVLNFSCDIDGNIVINSGEGVYEIKGRPHDEFPSIPHISEPNTIEVDTRTLSRMIRKTLVSVSNDEMKPALLGVLLQVGQSEIKMVSSDVHRLTCVTNKNFRSDNFETEVILPTKFMQLLTGYLDSDGTTNLTLTKNHIKVEIGYTVIYSRLLDEQFPDYEKVIPLDNDKIIMVDKIELMAALKRVSIFTDQISHQISFAITPGTAELNTIGSESYNRADDKVQIDYDGEELVIGLNALYFRELLANIDTQKAILKMDTPVSANLLVPETQKEDEEIVMILMPIRLEETDQAD